jgi:hypothetical protein
MRTLPVGAAFSHSVNSTINNLKFAFHVSWPWMLVFVPLSIFGNTYFRLYPMESEAEMSVWVGGLGFLMAIVEVVSFASIAVSWHRYILKDEVPQGIGDRLRIDGVVWRYIGNTILIWLRCVGIVLLAYIPMLAGFALMSVSQALGAIVMIISGIGLLVLTIWLVGAAGRWSTKLVGIALGRSDFLMKDAWAATEGNHAQIFWLYLLFGLCIFAVGLGLVGLTLAAASLGNVLALVVVIAMQTVVNWMLTIWGVTLLTSLYGFFVEKREF